MLVRTVVLLVLLLAACPAQASSRQLIAAGADHTCLIVREGNVVCWGGNSQGQLGNGTRASSHSPVKVKGLKNAVALAAGAGHTCAVVRGGHVWCWGRDLEAMSARTLHANTEPKLIARLAGVSRLAAKFSHVCALSTDGTVHCWGNNVLGQLGDGTGKATSSPVLVELNSKAKAIAAGIGLSCAVMTNGRVKCWGSDETSSGASFAVDSLSPVTIPRVRNAVAVAAARNFACALVSNGSITCWGSSLALPSSKRSRLFGKPLGRPENPSELGILTKINGITNANNLSMGAFHGCAHCSDGRVRCWGRILQELDPTKPVPGLADAISLASGVSHSCAVLASGTVKCWGENHHGQLGDGTTMDTSSPVEVKGLKPFLAEKIRANKDK